MSFWHVNQPSEIRTICLTLHSLVFFHRFQISSRSQISDMMSPVRLPVSLLRPRNIFCWELSSQGRLRLGPSVMTSVEQWTPSQDHSRHPPYWVFRGLSEQTCICKTNRNKVVVAETLLTTSKYKVLCDKVYQETLFWVATVRSRVQYSLEQLGGRRVGSAFRGPGNGILQPWPWAHRHRDARHLRRGRHHPRHRGALQQSQAPGLHNMTLHNIILAHNDNCDKYFYCRFSLVTALLTSSPLNWSRGPRGSRRRTWRGWSSPPATSRSPRISS